MSQAKKKGEVAVVVKTAIVVQDDVPDYIKQGAQRGSENVTTNDIAIPRLEVIQGLSPAVKRGDPGYIQGAQVGTFINSVSKELYGEEVFIVPIYYTKQYLVWKMRKRADGTPVEGNGGFFGAFNTEQEANERCDREGGTAKDIEVIDTPQHFCLLVRADGTAEEIMISMPKTKAKVSRQWNSMIRMADGDRFSRAYKMKTVLEKNPKGDFYNFEVALAGFPSRDIYAQAEKTYTVIAAGDRRVVMDVSDFDDAEDRDVEM